MSLHTTEYPRAQQDSSPDLGLSRSAFSSSKYVSAYMYIILSSHLLTLTVTASTTQTTRFEGDYRGILPFELEERIIDIIAAQVALSPSFERLWKSTLLSCALTCRAWAHRCRMHIFRFVSITTKTSFTNFLSFVSSKVAPLHSEVESIEARQSYPPHNETRFNHLVPHFLATRLPFVSHFILHDRGDKPCVHHPSIYIHLTQFKSITKLELHDHHFPCLNDTRRFICAFPSLVDVILNNVKWGTTANQRRILPKPLIRATKWTMMDLKVHFSGEISTAGLYFWILPPNSRGPLSNVGEQRGRRIHPGLSLRDALEMKGILDALEQEKYLLDFECFSQLGGCK